MFGKSLIVAASTLALLAPAAQADTVNPDTGKIDGYTYGESPYNTYYYWGWLYSFSNQHIGVSPAPVAGVPFYLHAHAAIVGPDLTGNLLLTIDQDAGGLPLRYAPNSAMPMRCFRTQFDPIISSTEIACPATVGVENGSYVVSKLEPLVAGFGLDVLFPVVVDNPASGTAAMTAMWATTDVTLSNNNVLATVPVTVAANPNPPTLKTKKLPSKLRKAKKVHSVTPKTCSVTKKKVVFHRHKVCKLVGRKHGHKVRAKLRY